jgi:hypothetical protein
LGERPTREWRLIAGEVLDQDKTVGRYGQADINVIYAGGRWLPERWLP